MSAYTLRRIDPDLWRKVKARAAYDGKTVRDVLMELLRVYATHGGEFLDKLNDDQRRR